MKLEIKLDEKKEVRAILDLSWDEIQALKRLTRIGIAHSDGSVLSAEQCEAETTVHRILEKIQKKP